jgi:hypothetical protein
MEALLMALNKIAIASLGDSPRISLKFLSPLRWFLNIAQQPLRDLSSFAVSAVPAG